MSTIQCPACGHSIAVTEKKSGLWWGLGCLFASIGGLVALAVLGMLAAIAIPSFVKARETAQQHACMNNLRVIEAAKEQARLERAIAAGGEIPSGDLARFLPDGAVPVCPAGGEYAVGPAGRRPECSRHGTMDGAADPRSGGR